MIVDASSFPASRGPEGSKTRAPDNAVPHAASAGRWQPLSVKNAVGRPRSVSRTHLSIKAWKLLLKVESAKDLPSMDYRGFGRSDPYVSVTLCDLAAMNPHNLEPEARARTAVIKSNNNPGMATLLCPFSPEELCVIFSLLMRSRMEASVFVCLV
jgi:hypothetical protein